MYSTDTAGESEHEEVRAGSASRELSDGGWLLSFPEDRKFLFGESGVKLIFISLGSGSGSPEFHHIVSILLKLFFTLLPNFLFHFKLIPHVSVFLISPPSTGSIQAEPLLWNFFA